MRSLYKNILLPFVVLLITIQVGYAEIVTQKQAKAIATQFFNVAKKDVPTDGLKYVYNGRRLTTKRLFVPFYVFSHPDGGYVIISADNKAFPILGYSLTDQFNFKDTDEKTQSWLRAYARDIELIRYDDRVPYEAINAWTDINSHIKSILSERYVINPLISKEDGQQIVDNIVNGEEWSDVLFSDIYTPSQWQEMINLQLESDGNITLGLLNKDRYEAFIIHGHKGDYYRIDTNSANDCLIRLFATEYLSNGQVADLNNLKPISKIEEREIPFKFYDDFVAEIERERKQQNEFFDNLLKVSEPELLNHGSGLFTVRMPEEVLLVRVYSINGAMVRQYLYKNTTEPHIDILDQSDGFYVALILGASGKVYGVKLAR